jgi:hypothetical protein
LEWWARKRFAHPTKLMRAIDVVAALSRFEISTRSRFRKRRIFQ